jgi:uncharacterized repeat protein (TIGR03803 family)
MSPTTRLTSVNGAFYGTSAGGPRGYGTVFFVTRSGIERVLHLFGGKGDGMYPSFLIDVGGTLYGTTAQGGDGAAVCYSAEGCGTVFSVNPTTGAESVIYAFKDGSDGGYPRGGLINVGGTLYGTTAAGGGTGCNGYGCGTVFSVTPSGIETVLYTFKGGNDGANPNSSLVNVGGTLYGTTGAGFGTVFGVTLSGTERVLYAFKWGADGQAPVADSLLNVNGTLYGTTMWGGGRVGCGGTGCGTVFSVALDGTEKVLHAFHDPSRDGSEPLGGLVNVNGTLYGTTSSGGLFRSGTAFSITQSGTFTLLHTFGQTYDAASPQAGMIDVRGTLFGTTTYGGQTGCQCGTVFAIKP